MRSASRAVDTRITTRVTLTSRTSDLKIGTLVGALQGVWRYRASVVGLVGPVNIQSAKL